MLKAYLIGCIIAMVWYALAIASLSKRCNVTLGATVIYIAVIATSWFGLIVTAATFVDDTKWGKKIVIRNRNLEEE